MQTEGMANEHMASWMAHLRIADKLLDCIGELPQTHFVVGNIAPDSGEPVDGNWNIFTPSKDISHWKLEGVPRSERAEHFRAKYLDQVVTAESAAFYLGYYAHLLTDYIWIRDVYSLQREEYVDEFAKDSNFIWQIKRNISDLDHLFFKEQPDFRAFSIFSAVTSFPNIYLDYFSKSAFEKKIAYITGVYKDYNGDLNREHPYFKKDEMDSFVSNAAKEIQPKLDVFLKKGKECM